ncbi:MAG TPA: carotenoid 1,2-hydratase [Deltaproteobacteria bacterium]|nr:carotenoid 1,2-hydratase [Deltaproteobacteria bacterium]
MLQWSIPQASAQDGYKSVTGPCNLSFPRDHGSHPGFRTEWWYYTGNLENKEGNRFGFQLTFFRSQISPMGAEKIWPSPASAWRTQQVYLGHAAITDVDGKQHLRAEEAARGALGIAGANQKKGGTDIILKTWSARIEQDNHRIKAQTDNFSFDLSLIPLKPLVMHGDNGYSRKGTTPEKASCYYSYTRLKTMGRLTIGGKSYTVEGLSWMDHEFSTAPLESGLSGWDWFSLQLSDHTEIMIFLLRDAKGGLGPASSGTYIDDMGNSIHISKKDFHIKVLDVWKSPVSHAVYPSRWRIRIFPMNLDVTVNPNLDNQEMQTTETTGVTYWEGSVSIAGSKNKKSVTGIGYVELTGYAKTFDAPM